jgi:hypothetical protein
MIAELRARFEEIADRSPVNAHDAERLLALRERWSG